MKKYKLNTVNFRALNHEQRMAMFGRLRCLLEHQKRLKALKARGHEMLRQCQLAKRYYRNDQTNEKAGLLTELWIAHDDWIDMLDQVDGLTDKVRAMKNAIWLQSLRFQRDNGNISTSDLIHLELSE